MQLTTATLATIVGGSPTAGQRANMGAIVAGLDSYGEKAGLLLPHRLAQFVPQVAHESARFVYDHEIWGPTPAQKRYDTRTDLGNTAAVDGDGYLYRGRTEMQLTGKRNYEKFRDWCRAGGLNPPDFVAEPDRVNEDPWEGLVAIWYWDVGNPEAKSLNRYADTGNNEMVTRRINGGLNGLADRLELYTRTALVFLDYTLTSGVIAAFQKDHGLAADDVAGPVTRAGMHAALVTMGKIEGGLSRNEPTAVPSAPPAAADPAPAPVARQPDVPAAIAKLQGAIADLAPAA